MGKKRTRIIGVGLLLSFLCGFALQVLRPHEVVYQGKPLHHWFRVVDSSHGDDVNENDGSLTAARRAILALGTNALPDLLAMVSVSSRWTWPGQVADKLPYGTVDFLHLPDPDSEHQLAAWAFEQLGATALPAVPALARLLRSQDSDLQWNAAECVARIGPAARAAVPGFMPLLQNTNLQMREMALTCLARIGPGAEATVPALIVLLEEARTNWPSQRIVRSIAHTLVKIGPAARPAAPALAALTNSPTALAALIYLTGQTPQPLVEQLRNTANANRWRQVADSVTWLGTNAAPAVPYLISALTHTNDTIKFTALRYLGVIHAEPETCVPVLVNLLKSKDSETRASALVALRQFGPAARTAVPEIEPFLQDSGKQFRDLARWALRDIREPGPTDNSRKSSE